MFKKLITSAAFLAATTMPALADDAAPAAPQLTPDEAKVQAVVFKVQDCIDEQKDSGEAAAQGLAQLRAQVSEEATAAGLKGIGFQDQVIAQILAAIRANDERVFSKIIFQAVLSECKAKFGADTPEMEMKTNNMANKYGPEIFVKPESQPAP